MLSQGFLELILNYSSNYYLFRNDSRQYRMDIVDLHDPARVKRTPDNVEVLMSSGKFVQDDFMIFKIELRLYIEKTHKDLGDYSLITSFVETDRGTVEMIYDEGFRGENPLSRASRFLTSNLGISALVLRSVISLREKLQ